MNRIVDTKEYLDTVCALLAEGARDVPVPVKGISMRPFLRDQDTVYLSPVEKPVKPGDILLFQRPGGRYILHRVHRSLGDGNYAMLGDNQTAPETISPVDIRGIVTFVRIGDREFRPGSLRWEFFARPWRWLAFLRRPIGYLHHTFRQPDR